MSDGIDGSAGIKAMYDGDYDPVVRMRFQLVKDHLSDKANFICVSCGGEKSSPCTPCGRCGYSDCDEG